LILEGEGGYTIVDSERVAMHPGDFVITPTWSLHDHGADGDSPVIWLDGLDVPIVNLLNAGFSEDERRTAEDSFGSKRVNLRTSICFPGCLR
jgi:gentisate 1,2-dioxygenase